MSSANELNPEKIYRGRLKLICKIFVVCVIRVVRAHIHRFFPNVLESRISATGRGVLHTYPPLPPENFRHYAEIQPAHPLRLRLKGKSQP